MPADLISLLGKRELVKSLRTLTYSGARYEARVWEARVYQLFEDSRFLLARYPRAVGASYAYRWMQIVKLPNDKQRELDHHFNLKAEELTQELFYQYFQAYSDGMPDAIPACYRLVHTQLKLGSESILKQVDEAVTAAHFAAGVPELADWALAGGRAQMLRSIDACIAKQIERLKSPTESASPFVPLYAPSVVAVASPAANSTVKPSGPTVAEAFKEYRKTRESGAEQQVTFTKDSLDKYAVAVRTFTYHFGANTPLNSIQAEQLSKFVEVYCQLPSDYSVRIKSALKEGSPYPTLESMAAAVQDESERIARAAVRRILTCIVSAYTFFATRRPSYGIADLSAVLKVSVPKSKSKDKIPFPSALLPKIFNSEYVEKCRRRAERFWLPLVMLYTGMRPNEIAQLYCTDIVFDDPSGSYWVRCTEDEDRGQKLKTKPSFRAVPIPQRLVDFGFLRYRDAIAEKGEERLFPRVWEGKEDYPSKPVVKWASKTLIRPVTDDKKITLYSARHSFAAALRQENVPEESVGRLMGHATGSSTTLGYGQFEVPLTIRPLAAIVEVIDWSAALQAVPNWEAVKSEFDLLPTTSKEQ